MLRDHALDAVRARLRAAAPRVLEVRDAVGVAGLRSQASGDAAWLELEGLAGADLPLLVGELARLLRPGAPVVCVAPRAASWRRALAPLVDWRRERGLAILWPSAPGWPGRHPLGFALLAAAEHVVSGWPLLRSRGRWAVHEGVRR